METHLQVVRRLADGRHHSGEVLAEALGISRAAVWKAVHKAGETLGLEIRSKRGMGYRLSAPLELLDPGFLSQALTGDARGRIAEVRIFDDIPSTNAYLIEQGRAGAPSGVLCLAERQSAGRGRRGRGWVSPFGVNIYLSLLWRFAMGPGELGALSLAVGTAVAAVLESEGVEGVALKWPNDLLWRRRKLAGLLLEVVAEVQGPSLVVVGLGLNTRLRGEEADAIDQPWVDLDEILGRGAYSRNGLAARLADALSRALALYEQAGFAPFAAEWQRYDLYRGEELEVRLGDRVVRGLHAGVSPQGALRLDVRGSIQTFHGGEVTLRAVSP